MRGAMAAGATAALFWALAWAVLRAVVEAAAFALVAVQ